jgi:alkaline phosphatase
MNTPSHRRAARACLSAGVILALASPLRAEPRAAAPENPRSVVLMIPDGCGPATLALARMVSGHALALDGMLTGMVTTRSADRRVTDSAAAATALATGHKTYNGGISEDPSNQPLGTLLEAAAGRGKATGLVVTSRMTHATPAAFAAHVDERVSEDEIAEQMLAHDVDVLLGGGRERFVGTSGGGVRRDGRDLLAEARGRGTQVVTDRAGLLKTAPGPRPTFALQLGPLGVGSSPSARTRLLGLFATDHMSFAMDADTLTQPRLVEMTRVALERLSRESKGFFLMVEGSRIDHAAHSGDAPATVREVLEYDAAVREVLEFARHDGNTLVVSVADHETGGLALGRRLGDSSVTDLRPEVVARVRRSAEAMAARMHGGADPLVVLREDAGVDSLGAEESAWIADGLAGKRPLEWGIGEIVSRRAGLGWATYGHTAADVALHAWGPGATRFAGLHDNTEVASLIARLLGLDLDAVTAHLRQPVPAPAR